MENSTSSKGIEEKSLHYPNDRIYDLKTSHLLTPSPPQSLQIAFLSDGVNE